MSDDIRDFNGDFCPVCCTHYSEPCEDGCDCADCLNRAERAHQARVEDGETFRGDEAAAYERDQQIDIYTTLK